MIEFLIFGFAIGINVGFWLKWIYDSVSEDSFKDMNL